MAPPREEAWPEPAARPAHPDAARAAGEGAPTLAELEAALAPTAAPQAASPRAQAAQPSADAAPEQALLPKSLRTPRGAALLAPAPFDPWLAASLTVLLGLGLVVVFSASAIHAGHSLNDAHRYLRQQAIWTALGLVAMVVTTFVPQRLLARRCGWLWLGTVFLLALVLVPGVGRFVGGARRWLPLGPVGCQPSEAAKLSMVIVLSALFARAGKPPLAPAAMMGPLIACQVPVLLILLEPDLGGAIVIELLLAMLLFAAGLRPRVLLILTLSALPVLYHLVVGTPFRLRRVLSYIDPWAFRQSTGYQVTEALISIGSGGAFGVGLGDGKQKLFFLPEAHTDFIFAIFAEELGLVGVSVLVLAFFVFVWRGIKLSLGARSAFEAYLSLGLTALVGIPAVLNLAVVTGLLPTKGLPLPFISYGGSNLVVTLVGVGLMWRIDLAQRAARLRAEERELTYG